MKAEIAQAIVQLERLGGQLYLDGMKVKYRPAGDPRIEPLIQKLRPYREEVRMELQERRSLGSILLNSVEVPTRRCRACNSWLFWLSTHGTAVCAACRPPAKRELVKQWVWIEEGRLRIQ